MLSCSIPDRLQANLNSETKMSVFEHDFRMTAPPTAFNDLRGCSQIARRSRLVTALLRLLDDAFLESRHLTLSSMNVGGILGEPSTA
ncbi:hypothetical protein Plhal304r1_c004g0015881 [Plasmopara halstedii]